MNNVCVCFCCKSLSIPGQAVILYSLILTDIALFHVELVGSKSGKSVPTVVTLVGAQASPCRSFARCLEGNW